TRSDKYYVGLEGAVTFQVEGRAQTLQASELLLISKGEWFSYTNATDREARLLLVHVPPFDLGAEEFR
ncbi:MAG: cupin domain-containing protein, partial [bacterium]